MTMHIFVSVLLASLTALAQPSAKPDFSGEWKMNAARSDFGPVPAPSSMTRSITHAEPALTIVENQSGGMGEQSVTRKYVTDGSDTTFPSQGVDVKSSAKWADNTLVFLSSVDVVGITFNDTMSLSSDGKSLTSKVKITSPQGDVEVTIVFEKQ